MYLYGIMDDKEIAYLMDAVKNTPQYHYTLIFVEPKKIIGEEKDVDIEVHITENGSEEDDNDDADLIPKLSLRKKIIGYLAHDWIDTEQRQFPLDTFCNWVTWYGDMCKLSKEFPDIIFKLYGKGVTYIDDLFVKIFKGGDMVGSSTKVSYKIGLTELDDTVTYIDPKTGYFSVPPESKLGKQEIFSTKERDLETVLTTLMDVGITAADLGIAGTKIVCEASLILKIVAVALQIASTIQTTILTVRANKRKCIALAERCQNLLLSAQNIPPSQMKLGVVISMLKSVIECSKLINSYNRQWAIWKVLSNQSNQRRFIEMNETLSNSLLDLVASYQINKKNFDYLK